jgi:tRNA pseudouridine55 synthase
MNAVLIIDKPAGLTSHDVVNRARRILRERSIGHLGTLDPMATGVLPLVTGNLTRLAQFYTSSEKIYEGTVRFGFATDTYDADGDPTTTPQEVTLSGQEIETMAARFRGVIEQTPPPFSAKKIKGVPAYKLARQQKEVVLKPVQVEIKEFEILAVEKDRVRFRARVASGTYMRSVAHEMGRELACGAHLESLRRTAVAEFTLEDAHTLEEVANLCHPDRSLSIPQGETNEVEGPGVPDSPSLDALCVHPRELLPLFPSVTADEVTVALIRNGRTVNLPDVSRARLIKVFSSQRDLIAIATRIAGTLFHPKIVLCG